MRNRIETGEQVDPLTNAKLAYQAARAEKDRLLATPGVTAAELNESSLALLAARTALNLLRPLSTRRVRR
jgi:hypothetical protein